MRIHHKLLAIALVCFWTSTAAAQESLLDYVVTNCESDLEKYCSQVTPGEGRLLHCVAAHEDKLSGQCDYALYRAASLLEQLGTAIAYIAESCGEEIQTLCKDVEMGEGRVMACLKENEAELGDNCKSAVANTMAP